MASPWIFRFSGGAASTNAVVSGVIIVVISIAALAAFSVWEEWLNLIMGLWVLVSPWVLHIVIGVIVAVGTIERLMLDKRSGVVAYAVVKTRGRFGADQHHYPLSWVTLKYNPPRKVYEADVTLEALRSGPSELDGEAFDWGDRSRPYQHPLYWGV